MSGGREPHIVALYSGTNPLRDETSFCSSIRKQKVPSR